MTVEFVSVRNEAVFSMMAIPKFIYQTTKSKFGLPVALEENIEQIKDLNKGWAYRLFDDWDIEDFIRNVYGQETLVLYNKINPAYGAGRADLFRYLLIYETGGIYLDIKSGVTQALDTVLLDTDEYILSHWPGQPGHRHFGWGRHRGLGMRGEFQNWHVIATPKHPFLKQIIGCVLNNIKNYNPAKDGVGKFAVLRVTGPIAYSLAIEAVKRQHSYRYAESETLGLRYSVLETQANLLAHEQLFEKPYRGLTESICLPDFEIGSRNWANISRNESCPCGSGQRYKNCHGKLN